MKKLFGLGRVTNDKLAFCGIYAVGSIVSVLVAGVIGFTAWHVFLSLFPFERP